MWKVLDDRNTADALKQDRRRRAARKVKKQSPKSECREKAVHSEICGERPRNKAINFFGTNYAQPSLETPFIETNIAYGCTDGAMCHIHRNSEIVHTFIDIITDKCAFRTPFFFSK